MALSKDQRDALSSDDFAVPSKRELPIHDETHVRLAWDMVERTADLTDSEKATARARILKKAKELGMSTKEWSAGAITAYAIPELKKLPLHDREHILMAANAINTVKGITDNQRIEGRINIAVEADRYGLNVKAARKTHLHFESMAIEMPTVVDHPNRHPFSGVLTRLDIASDFPVGGTTSKKVVIPTAVAEAAIPSLLGMAVDHTKDFKGHDRKQKIGIITEAFIGEVDEVLGTPLHIAGFFYAADFPTEVGRIQAERELLGFSYEAEAFVASVNSDPWVCTACDFTGAAVLYKDKAAFTSTSIHASKDTGESTMTEAEIKALQAKADKADALEAANKKLTEEAALAAEAALKHQTQAASLQKLVKPHADALRSAATNMVSAGIGAASENGHAAILNKMADQMEAQSVMGKIPNTFDSYFYGSAAPEKQVQEAAAKLAAEAKQKDELAAMQTKLDDALKAKAALEAGAKDEGKKKALNASAAAGLKKLGLAESPEGITVAVLDAACKKAGMSSVDSISLKINLRAAGALV